MRNKKAPPQPEPEEVFIDEDHDIYKNNPINKFYFRYGGGQKDNEIINHLLKGIIVHHNAQLTVQRLFQYAEELSGLIGMRTRGIDTIKINFNKASRIDEALWKMEISKKWHYFTFPWFGYFQNSNQIHFMYLFTNYPKNLGGLLKPFLSTTFGYKWNYNKN